MAVLPYSHRNWIDFFAAAGRPEIMQEPQFSDNDTRLRRLAELYRIVSEVLPAQTTAYWTAVCTEHDIPHSPVNDMTDLLANRHLQQVGFWHQQNHPVEGGLVVPSFPVRYGGPFGDARPAERAPLLGEHTSAILAGLDITPGEIARLLATSVVGASAPTSPT